MKVLHLCLSCFYIDEAGYQENQLVRQNIADGHEVLVIASTEIFDGCGGLKYIEPSSYRGSDGAQVIRLPYVAWLPQKIARKLRIHNGVYDLISQFNPGAILFHGCAGNEIVTVSRYAAKNPELLFYVDSHEDKNNSARNFISLNLLHKIFYRNRLIRALPQIRKILCINVESMYFMNKTYGVPWGKLEFFPLGGEILSVDTIMLRRNKVRESLNQNNDVFVFIQSGKMTKRKKLSSSLVAFSNIPGDHLQYWIAGLLTDEVRAEIEVLVNADKRVKLLGWKTPQQLSDLLCAADAYVQPGTQSVTMQNALCCGCPVIIDDVPGHQPYIPSGAILVQDQATLQNAMLTAASWRRDEKRSQALAFANSTLDYKCLATRFLHP
jgi:1,2-diacylglycerol 3-alpha-glucosyltransferase